MKKIERNILQYQQNDFLAPIRDKISFARLLVIASRQLLLNEETEGYSSVAKLRLVIDKMSRIFIYQRHRYFSVAFPFTVLTDDNNNVINITSLTGNKLDFQNISAIIAILDNDQFRHNPSLISFSLEPQSIEYSGIPILEEIFRFEPSYVRYDYDNTNEGGKFHPLNHLDINYSQSGTFKLGLPNVITETYFENLQDTNKQCSYIIDKIGSCGYGKINIKSARTKQ